MTVMNISFTLQNMAMYILTSWLSGYHTKIRQTLSAGRQPTRKTDGTEATFGSYLIKRYKAEASSVRTLQHFLSSLDRKSTRLNSSHLVISYAVFCLKKKK